MPPSTQHTSSPEGLSNPLRHISPSVDNSTQPTVSEFPTNIVREVRHSPAVERPPTIPWLCNSGYLIDGIRAMASAAANIAPPWSQTRPATGPGITNEAVREAIPAIPAQDYPTFTSIRRPWKVRARNGAVFRLKSGCQVHGVGYYILDQVADLNVDWVTFKAVPAQGLGPSEYIRIKWASTCLPLRYSVYRWGHRIIHSPSMIPRPVEPIPTCPPPPAYVAYEGSPLAGVVSAPPSPPPSPTGASNLHARSEDLRCAIEDILVNRRLPQGMGHDNCPQGPSDEASIKTV
ncbi:hypothetical protein EIP91_009852 [Steccherinum ochraceum]|uniref:Uncharacterized protein n=1 Tax=Steccherinum ochraceum TaxID=92696 RepID=A0A4R0RAG5_9APHY|nr:hypothetical protein EIP91_009852 [Steccherinum ochraceum]